MPGLYDLVILLDPNAPEERQAEILRDVKALIESGGTLVSEHDWGVRRMAYEIDHRPEAAYHVLQFEAEPALLERLRHTLKITDGVLRQRTIRAKPGAPPPPAPRPEAPRPREEEAGDTQVAPRAAADAPAGS
jgi:small subunit ribosomal protein S6